MEKGFEKLLKKLLLEKYPIYLDVHTTYPSITSEEFLCSGTSTCREIIMSHNSCINISNYNK